MKIKVVFKDPDTLSDTVQEAARSSMPEGLSEAEKEAIMELRTEKIYNQCSKWFAMGEYMGIEIDTEADTARVLEAREY